jgi:glutathione synthase/RimK-type ligase-like ATP-grasp enzyme
MGQHEVYIVTYSGLPHGAPEDQMLAAAIQRRGGAAAIVGWDAPNVDWSRPTKMIIRSTWNYHVDLEAWDSWVTTASSDCELLNAGSLLRWNADKRYLLDLEQLGVPIVPTLYLSRGTANIGSLLSEQQGDVIVKPNIGASSIGVKRFSLPALREACQRHIERLLQRSDVLLQPFQTVVENERERSLVFVAGHFTHAFTKPAFHPGISAGTHVELRIQPTDDELALARHALATLAELPAYARVDLVPSDDGPLLMELELIEPHLAFHLEPECCARLAGHLLSGKYVRFSSEAEFPSLSSHS